MTEAYPLCWPMGWHRTPDTSRQRARFQTTFGIACAAIIDELRLMGVSRHLLVISTNIPLRQDGLPYASAARGTVEDPGVAIYFLLNNRQQCIPCDKWDRVEDNLQAVRKTIEALRGIDRWGAKDMVDAAFRGFAALPPPSQDPNWWRDYLGFKPGEGITRQMLDEAFVAMAKVHHPDKPTGSKEAFQRLQAARVCAMQEVTN